MKSYKMNSLDYLCFIIILIITSCNRTYNKSEDGLYAIDPRTFVDNKIFI